MISLGGRSGRERVVGQRDAARRPLIPRAIVERATAGLGRAAAPLLEEERNARAEALIADVRDPFKIHWASVMPALAARDHPVHSVATKHVLEIQRAEQRFA